MLDYVYKAYTEEKMFNSLSDYIIPLSFEIFNMLNL